jgi:hypothetical protein
MRHSNRLPFQNLTSDNWLNLALASVLAIFVFYFVWQMLLGRLCSQIGVDYCDFWSAGSVATTHGYAAVYDLRLLDRAQKSILPAHLDPTTIPVVPFPYLPIFAVPFQLLPLLPLAAGFILWSALNLGAFLLYLKFFASRLNLQPFSMRLHLLILASLPAFLNVFTGQVSLWLVICVGEFMRAYMQGRPFRGGLWLGGLMLKPQALILIVPILLLQRSFRAVAGLAACLISIGVASAALMGQEGLLQMFALWRTYAKGQASNWIEGMVNFRMLGFHLSTIAPSWTAWIVAAAGTVVVLILAFRGWRRPFDPRSPMFPIGILGILAATTAVAWHSHIHMAMILIPPMLLLHQAGILPPRALYYWVFVPSVLFLLAVFAPPALARLNMIPDAGARFIYFFLAAAQLAANLYLFWWSLRTSRLPQSRVTG